MKMNDKTYNILAWIARVVLPAITAFYGVIGNTLEIPHTAEVLTILAAFTTFVATILGISTANYKAGQSNEPTIVADDYDDDVEVM